MSAEELFGTQIYSVKKKERKKKRKTSGFFKKEGLTAFSVQILIKAAKRVE